LFPELKNVDKSPEMKNGANKRMHTNVCLRNLCKLTKDNKIKQGNSPKILQTEMIIIVIVIFNRPSENLSNDISAYVNFFT